MKMVLVYDKSTTHKYLLHLSYNVQILFMNTFIPRINIYTFNVNEYMMYVRRIYTYASHVSVYICIQNVEILSLMRLEANIQYLRLKHTLTYILYQVIRLFPIFLHFFLQARRVHTLPQSETMKNRPTWISFSRSQFASVAATASAVPHWMFQKRPYPSATRRGNCCSWNSGVRLPVDTSYPSIIVSLKWW